MPETMDVPIQGLPVITGEGSASKFLLSGIFLDLRVNVDVP
jgi:hypothetical protein